ncbi:MAG TPA: D-glycero-beta-D-manno-heptose-7-phosphate kinase, partial [Alphaproteobacteria bacterium]|nr:D-glycero-beta-D-manno-heptose-7-phosphate kinase [Alphaproteobacteria bacterium]
MSLDDNRRLNNLISNFGRCNILVLGDFMYDKFTHGSVDRISPEAPIPVIRVKHNHEMLGGAGNAALNIVSAGGKATLISVVGDDPVGQKARELVMAQIGSHSVLVSEANRQTTIKQRFIANNQQLLRADTETTAAITAETEKKLLAAYETALPNCQAVMISDYAKGVLTDGVLKTVIEKARAAGKPVLIDPKRKDFSAYAGATLVKPNRKEISEAVGEAINTDEEFITAGKKLLQLGKFDYLVATRGKDGLTVLDKDSAKHVTAQQREVWDVSGAGDTVIALLALGIAAGGSVLDAAQLANIAAGIVVGKVGTATVTAAELSHAVDATDEETEAQSHLQNIMTVEQAVEQVARWRRLGLKIGFTNGVFDLLHPGHLSSLRQAHATCDKLIVGVNSDDSVRRLKGPDR